MDRDHRYRSIMDDILFFAPDAFLEQDEEFEDLEPSSSGITFYDRHMDSKLLCKHVEEFPTIGPVMSKIFDEALTKYVHDGYGFQGFNFLAIRDGQPTLLEDANSVFKFYRKKMGNLAHTFPSRFNFHPNSSWYSVFDLREESCQQLADFSQESTLHLAFNVPADPSSDYTGLAVEILKSGQVDKLKDIRNRYPHFATWHFYPMTGAGKYILKQIQASSSFDWETSRTVGYLTRSSTSPPLDAEDGILRKARIIAGKPAKSKKRPRKLAKEEQDQGPVDPLLLQRKSAYVSVSRKPTKNVERRLDARRYLQHAWATAVERDSTFMIFNCGVYERIGVRHRESQTLYLSPLIEPINCQNPPYGKLHVGLHTAIVQDVLQRYERDVQQGGKKRSADHLDSAEIKNVKRRKQPPSESDNGHIKEIAKELGKRELALVTLNYGVYLSPTPAAFLRLGSSCSHGLYQPFNPTKKYRFPPTDYFELTMGKSIGSGAVGVIHPATLSFTLESGERLEHDLIVKLAFMKTQQEKLRKEYEIYAHLAMTEEPVGEIVTVHGLFEDPDSGTLALFMENGGRSLAYLEQEEPTRYTQLVSAERPLFVQALKNIHKAGVRHRDIRPDNILVNSADKVCIIDFDRAVLDAKFPWLPHVKNELMRLEAVLNGKETNGVWIS